MNTSGDAFIQSNAYSSGYRRWSAISLKKFRPVPLIEMIHLWRPLNRLWRSVLQHMMIIWLGTKGSECKASQRSALCRDCQPCCFVDGAVCKVCCEVVLRLGQQRYHVKGLLFVAGSTVLSRSFSWTVTHTHRLSELSCRGNNKRYGLLQETTYVSLFRERDDARCQMLSTSCLGSKEGRNICNVLNCINWMLVNTN